MMRKSLALPLLIVLCLSFRLAIASQQQATAPSDSAPDSASQSRKGAQVENGSAKALPEKVAPAKSGKKPPGAKHAPPPLRDRTPKKIVVRQGSVGEPTAQIVNGMTLEEATRERDDAQRLLSTTSETLKEIAPRELNVQQQETVSQIHNYMEVARRALKEGDIPRAHTLAVKAGLLANDLAKH
ncbi:MAG: hypothetical protein ACRD3Q_16160 [Terriglobales bacterium]